MPSPVCFCLCRCAARKGTCGTVQSRPAGGSRQRPCWSTPIAGRRKRRTHVARTPARVRSRDATWQRPGQLSIPAQWGSSWRQGSPAGTIAYGISVASMMLGLPSMFERMTNKILTEVLKSHAGAAAHAALQRRAPGAVRQQAASHWCSCGRPDSEWCCCQWLWPWRRCNAPPCSGAPPNTHPGAAAAGQRLRPPAHAATALAAWWCSPSAGAGVQSAAPAGSARRAATTGQPAAAAGTAAERSGAWGQRQF